MVFFCLNSAIESIYFNKLTVKRAFQKSVLSPILPSYHAQPLNPQTTEWRQKGGALKPSLFWGRWNVDWEPRRIPPTVTPTQNRMGVPPPVRLCQPWRQGWPQAAHCSHTQLVHSPVRVSSLCREGSLSCNPKEIQTHTCEIRRNHWLPQESIKLYFIVFLVFVKDTYSHSR